MSLGQGFSGIVGAAKASGTWDSPTQAAATDLVPFESESFEVAFERIRGEILRGEAGRRADDQGPKKIGGSLPVILQYDQVVGSQAFGTDLLLAAALGACSYSGGVNTMTLADDITTLLTVAVHKGVSAWEFQTGKITGFRLRGAKGEPLKGEFELVFKDYTRSSSDNTPASLQTLRDNFAAKGPRNLTFDQVTFRLGDLADALAAGDALDIESFELAVNHNLRVDDFAAGSNLALEPLRDGFREVTLSFELSRYDADTLIGFYENDTELQCDITVTDGTNSLAVYLTTLKITGFGAPVEGAGLIRQRVDCACYRKSSSNTYMTDSSEELYIKAANDRTASPI